MSIDQIPAPDAHKQCLLIESARLPTLLMTSQNLQSHALKKHLFAGQISIPSSGTNTEFFD
jgi:hypothetical protein